MKTKFILLFTLSIFCSNLIKAQNFEVPENVTFNTKDDYTKYEKDVIACTNWLENSPLNENQEKRKKANAFLMMWLTGSPTVSINLNVDYVIKYTKKNPELLMIFMGGWTRYSLENNYSNDQQKGYYEGYKSMINVYKKGIGIKKDKNMESLVKIYDNGQLENWVKEKIK